NTIAPIRPLPTGRASSHTSAGSSYHKSRSLLRVSSFLLHDSNVKINISMENSSLQALVIYNLINYLFLSCLFPCNSSPETPIFLLSPDSIKSTLIHFQVLIQ